MRASYTFRSSLAMVTRGGANGAVAFGIFNLVGYTKQPMIF